MDVLVINGPNLNMLGLRNPAIYGRLSLADVEAALQEQAERLRVSIAMFQSNHEGAIIERIHLARREGVRYLILNAAGYTYTSVAIRDALELAEVPFVEVHISNVFAREHLRGHESLIAPLATSVIHGAGMQGYTMALSFIAEQIRGPEETE